MAEDLRRTAQLIRQSGDLIAASEAAQLSLRLLGGIAIAMHCDRAEEPHREFSDVDAVIRKGDVKSLKTVLGDAGYSPDARFNALNGHSRLVFYGSVGKLDVFVDRFEMCHRIPLADRLELDAPTLTVTDLLLTKLQVVEMNHKDFADLVLLIDCHDVRGGEGDHVNADYLKTLLGRDWGLWKTVNVSLEKLADRAPEVGGKVSELRDAASSGPRSLAFRLRGALGERAKWYEEPEEVEDV